MFHGICKILRTQSVAILFTSYQAHNSFKSHWSPPCKENEVTWPCACKIRKWPHEWKIHFSISHSTSWIKGWDFKGEFLEAFRREGTKKPWVGTSKLRVSMCTSQKAKTWDYSFQLLSGPILSTKLLFSLYLSSRIAQQTLTKPHLLRFTKTP